jgi:alpha-ketoglutarate-dependent taurine dioxygenase
MESMEMVAERVPVLHGGPGLPADLPDAALAQEQVLSHGAVLLRGFGVSSPADFERVVTHLAGPPLAYTERSSPRSALHGNLYTSTDYPAEEEIFLHNENSYQASWPRNLFFCCLSAPDTLGATPLADIRCVLALIDPAVREEFARRDWMVVRNFHSGFGPSLNYVFGTDDRHVIDDYCRRRGIATEWLPDGQFRTRSVRRAIHRHPETGEQVWFNHATFFHHSTLPADVVEGLSEIFAPGDLPTDSRYGDGEPIPDAVVAHLRDCYRQATVRFDWRDGDVLMIDNMLTAHGREPFTGTRQIAVAMTQLYPAGGSPD